ncbi:hypothetical protein SSYRP_v1c06710 [Spiroplasma syrphidicola EA-1]|uniref:Uncharacterized protein n=1 Tax=Spiroplasma syrphidicola EA-1 TaxID=1276229 RepID=R4UM04_9MOLU|nr:hypothetical protein [Spiroplasma syrphidicola]AGM26261.1 hypothetical protein SSYRP_v1c06710 [Spiroplasma syrphidicola EA-1]
MSELEQLEKILARQKQQLTELQQENDNLKKYIAEVQSLEEVSRYNIEKSHEAFEVASHNAGRIIMKAVDFSYAFKEEIANLLDEIDENRANPQAVLQAIDDFLERNKKIYAFTINDGTRISEMIKKEIINKIK